jgi:hypothetical protein
MGKIEGILMIRNLFASSVILFGSIAPSYAMSLSEGQYYFRSVSAAPKRISDEQNPVQNKDITVTFAGGVNVAFSERLPLRAEWEDDNWSIVGGSLPSGIAYNTATRTFSGTPTGQVKNQTVSLVGVDVNGNSVATADVTFDIYDLVAAQPKVEFYGHTGKYSFNQLPLPAGITVDDWQVVYAPPAGIQILGRNFDGVPTKAGTYPLFIRGLDFNGTVVVSYTGKFVVEDGPVFDIIADDLRSLPNDGSALAFGYNPVHTVRQANNPAQVRYFVEVAPGQKLPGSIIIGSDPFKRSLTGSIYNHYEQASIRLKAIDSDDTVGFSNWFKIGSLGPEPTCQSSQPITINAKVGQAFTWGPVKLTDNRGNRTYAINTGTLPDDVSFDDATGVLSGLPTKEQRMSDIKIDVNVINGANIDTTTCGPYVVDVAAADFNFSVEGPTNVRVGSTFSAELKTGGGLIAPYTITVDDVTKLPIGTSFNSATQKVEGTVTAAGNYSAGFTLTNGDGKVRKTTLTTTVHDLLKIDDVPAVLSIKRYETKTLVTATFDAATVMPGPSAPQISLSAPLPGDLTFSPSSFSISGGTSLPEGRYGPFHFILKDGSGNSVNSNDFHIDVTQRDPMVGTLKALQPFTLNFSDPGQRPFSVTVPTMAQSLPLTYALNGSLPQGLSFDAATGMISGLPVVKGTSTGFTVTVSDGELSLPSAAFDVVVEDAPMPDAAPIAPVTGNITGATPTFIKTAPVSFQGAQYEKTLIGGPASVVFTDYSPKVPGLNLNTVTGVISGVPTSTFDGDVVISFKDGADRPGQEPVHITVLPYPVVGMTSSSYNLPRLATATAYVAKPILVEGFRTSVVYAKAPSSGDLPAGVTVAANGTLTGSTSVGEKSFTGIVIRATDVASGISVDTQPFTINVVKREEITFNPAPTEIDYFISADGKTFSNASAILGNLIPGGSFVSPLVYSIVNQPQGITINSINGRLAGWPAALGTSTVTITVTDKEGSTKSADITIRGRLSGLPVISPGAEQRLVRSGETFETSDQTVTNNDGAVTFGLVDQLIPTMAFNTTTGKFKGYVEGNGTYSVRYAATDADNRTSQVSRMDFSIVAPLAFAASNPFSVNARQYDSAQAVDMTFPPVNFAMGTVTYGVDGDLPGTLIYKTYANNKATGAVSYLEVSSNGALTPITPAQFPLDALVFDTLGRTLKGIPSKAGSFQFDVVAFDDYRNSGYKVEPSDSTRDRNNFAALGPYVINAAAAESFVVSSTANSETIFQFTSQPTVKANAAGAAYGLPVTWSKLSGALPTNVIATTSGTSVNFSGYPQTTGTADNIVYQATDAAGRKSSTAPITFTVQARQDLTVTASSNPKGMVVNQTDADLTVTAKNTANGQNPTWVVSGAGNLPPGVGYAVVNGAVKFTGVATVLGTYTGVTVTATDSLGASKSVALTFRVISSSDAITLTVAEVTAKRGFAFSMNAPFSSPVTTANSYGALSFTSDDKPADVALNKATGEMTGTFLNAGTHNFNLKVQDETSRLTSKPVKITVLPNLRLIVGTLLTFEQGKPMSATIDTSYAIGAVTYKPGAGTWPTGLTVNPTYGTISGNATAASGTYSGLTIVGEDAIGDIQSSNTFSIKVDPINASPVIYDVSIPTLIVGTAMTSYRPWVQNNVNQAYWDYGDDLFTLTEPLPAGLSFDDQTGTISGTPTEAWSKASYQIRVTSVKGLSSITRTFAINVHPKNAIVARTGQKTSYTARVDSVFTSNAPLFDNTFGALTFSRGANVISGSTLTASTGVLFFTPVDTMKNTTLNYTVAVADGFGRTGFLPYTIDVKAPIVVTYPAIAAMPGKAIAPFTPTLSGIFGNASFSFSGLPSGISGSATTGEISGALGSGVPEGTTYPITVTVTDNQDGATKVSSFNIYTPTSNAHRYWAFQCNASDTFFNVAELRFYNEQNVMVSAQATATSLGNYNGFPVGNSIDGKDGTFYSPSGLNGTAGDIIYFDFKTSPQDLKKVEITKRMDYAQHNCISWTVLSSDNGVNYSPSWNGSYSSWNLTTNFKYMSIKP